MQVPLSDASICNLPFQDRNSRPPAQSSELSGTDTVSSASCELIRRCQNQRWQWLSAPYHLKRTLIIQYIWVFS